MKPKNQLFFTTALMFVFTCCDIHQELPVLPNNVTIQIVSKNVSSKSVVLNATQVNTGLKGAWTIELGEKSNASFSDATDPLATFTGDIFETYTIRWTISNNAESKYSEIVFKIAEGFTAKELLDAGITVEQLLQQGVTISELLSLGVSINDLLSANVSVADLINDNVDIGDLIDAEVKVEDLLEHGVSVQELLLAGVSVSTLLDSGVTALALFNAGILVGVLRHNGVTENALASYDLIGTLTDVHGNVYTWVKMGNQKWMSENLKVLKYSNGADIVGVKAHNSNEANVAIYGRQYTWAAAMNNMQTSSTKPSNVQGACPTEWHLPSDLEWKELMEYLGSDAGGKMKTTGTTESGDGLWQADDIGSDGTNTTGFNGVPGGASDQWMGERAFFWTATEQSGSAAWRPELIYHTRGIGYSYASKAATLSIRCLKN